MKTVELRELTSDEIAARIDELHDELFRLRFRSATQELDNPIRLRTLRRDVARLKTILRERATAGEGAGR